MLKPEILGQLLLMQNFVISLPDEKSIFSFVCRGLLDIPGVTGVRYTDTDQGQTDESIVLFPLLLGDIYRGELHIALGDSESFAPYVDYVKNFCYMLSVVLEERRLRYQNKLFQSGLEEKITERTLELQNAKDTLQEQYEELQVNEEELRSQNDELLRTEEALRQSEATFRAVAELSPLAIYSSSGSDQKATYINAAFYKIFGYSMEDVPTVGHLWIKAYPDEKYRQKVIDQWVYNIEEANKNDTDVELLECVCTCKDGSEKIIVWVGKTIGDEFWAFGYDFTERKQSEVEKAKLETQLQQAQKMESIGRLAGGVAHDFNNMLTVILGHAQLGQMHLDPAHPVCADLAEISKAAERSADLTRQLLAFARKQTIAPKVLDLNETVSGMFKMLQRLIGEDINLNWHPAPDLWPVNMDPSQIDQILANLCVNARDSITDVGKITIETGSSIIDEEYCTQNSGFMVGDYVRLAVSDDGCGMDKATQLHIFEPFFTTKGLGEGTGLGLATVYGIVRQNNGFINVYSEPGLGTAFTIYLPRYVGKAGPARTEGAVEPAKRGKETILLVEDEPAILNITSMILEKQGYTVLAANTPSEAIRLAGEHIDKIHLLMTDVVMPEMNGKDLARKLQSVYPQLKCLYMSGYTSNVIAHHGVLDEGINFIQKPFSLPDLASKVRDVLDGI